MTPELLIILLVILILVLAVWRWRSIGRRWDIKDKQ